MFRNSRSLFFLLPAFCCACAAFAITLAGCNDSQAEPVSAETSKLEVDDDPQPNTGRADKPLIAADQSTKQTSESTKDGNRSTTQPDGDRTLSDDEAKSMLVDVRSTIQRLRTERMSPVEQIKLMEDISTKSAQIVAAKAGSKTRVAGAEFKILAIRNLAMVKQEDPTDELEMFCKSLQNDRSDSLAQMGDRILTGVLLEKTLGDEKPDVAALHEKIANVVKANKDSAQVVRPFISEVLGSLMNKGLLAEASKVATLISAELKNSKDEELVQEAESLRIQGKAMTLEPLLQALLEKKEGAVENIQKWINNELAAAEPQEFVFRFSFQALRFLEMTGEYDVALECYAAIGKAFETHTDKQLAAKVAKSIAAATRRLDLIGKPLEVSGVTVDGKPLDWKKYAGKVVLLDFWGAGNREWVLRDFPMLSGLYKQYRDKGFEVVGVNVDQDVKVRDEFLKFEKLPWPTIVGANEDEQGLDHPLAVKCGVDVSPCNILIDQKGIVVAIQIRGRELDKKLTELLAEPTNPDAPVKPDPKKDAPNKKDPPKDDASDSTSLLDRELREFGFVAERGDALGSTLFAAEEAAEEKDGEKAADKPEDGDKPKKLDLSANPYLAPKRSSTAQLVNYLLNMSEKPDSIQERPGFSEAVIDAAERLIKMEGKGTYWRIGVISKFKYLHKSAAAGNEEFDKKLAAYVEEMKDATDKRIVKEVQFLQLERKAIDAEKLPMEKIEPLLAELKAYFEKQRLNERHMRIASLTVKAINQLDSEDEKEKEKYGDLREKYFKEFGELFAKSSYRDLAAYGKNLGKKPAAPGQDSDLVGKPLELAGKTASGMAFDWKAYRGKVVMVDFWATWCGPCVREMPNVKEFYEKHKEQGFDIVGISLDQTLDPLKKFIEENKVPWANLAGDEAKGLAQKYGVKAIPTMMLVDREGKVVAVSNRIETLKAEAEKLLAAKPKDDKKKPGE